MIRAYRMVGHLEANLDPLGITPKTPQATLDPKLYGFEGPVLDTPIFVDGILGFDTATPRPNMTGPCGLSSTVAP